MPVAFRHLTRTTCSLLIMVSLSVSMVESAMCDAPLSRKVQVGAVAGVALEAAMPVDEPSSVPDAGGAGCCPCIHTFPDRVADASLAARSVAASAVRIQFPEQFLTSRTSAPLVPPPIA